MKTESDPGRAAEPRGELEEAYRRTTFWVEAPGRSFPGSRGSSGTVDPDGSWCAMTLSSSPTISLLKSFLSSVAVRNGSGRGCAPRHRRE